MHYQLMDTWSLLKKDINLSFFVTINFKWYRSDAKLPIKGALLRFCKIIKSCCTLHLTVLSSIICVYRWISSYIEKSYNVLLTNRENESVYSPTD